MASRRYGGSGEAFDNIYVERDIATWEDLDERLRRMEHFIQNPPGLPLRLVVIDSIAHLFSDTVDFQAGRVQGLNCSPYDDIFGCESGASAVVRTCMAYRLL